MVAAHPSIRCFCVRQRETVITAGVLRAEEHPSAAVVVEVVTCAVASL